MALVSYHLEQLLPCEQERIFEARLPSADASNRRRMCHMYLRPQSIQFRDLNAIVSSGLD